RRHYHLSLPRREAALIQHLEHTSQRVDMQATFRALQNKWRSFRRRILVYQTAAEHLPNDLAMDRQNGLRCWKHDLHLPVGNKPALARNHCNVEYARGKAHNEARPKRLKCIPVAVKVAAADQKR